MKEKNEAVINRLPAKTWYWLDVNEAKVPWDEAGTVLLEETMVSAEEGEKFACPKLSLTGEAGSSQKNIHIKAAAGSQVALAIDYQTDKNLAAQLAFHAEENAILRLVQVYDGKADSRTRSLIKGTCEKNARIEIIQVILGEGDTYCDHQIKLEGGDSSLKIDIGYLGQKNQKIDINIVSDHYGKRSESEINVGGVLKDAAQKTFRGTIDFKNGATDAVGNEQETVLMLGEDVVNKTVPLILCAEENVVGNHGASIGELDEDTLFYFASRGIGREEAEAIMAKAAIQKVISLIGEEQERKAVSGMLGKALHEVPEADES